MQILCFPTGPYSTNMYIIYSEKTGEAVIVDPGVKGFETACSAIERYSLRPKAIWLTHSHWDHIVDVAKIQKALSLPTYVHPMDQANLEFPGIDEISMAVPKFEGAKADHLIIDGDILNLGEFSFTVIHTPGHSPGGVCFYCKVEHTLLSGDTLFQNAIGSISLPTSDPQQMKKSLQKLALLPPLTKVYPGHGPSTTIENEQRVLKRTY